MIEIVKYLKLQRIAKKKKTMTTTYLNKLGQKMHVHIHFLPPSASVSSIVHFIIALGEIHVFSYYFQ